MTARTRVFALLGDPVSHSLSPRMQNAAFQAAGVDAVYVVLQPSVDSIGEQMHALVRGGGGGNVTVPFKKIAAGVHGSRDRRVETLVSANVFGSLDGALQLANTDVDGILAALDQLGAPGDAWCVIGTGGSARAVVGAAAERGARIAVRSRDTQRGRQFAEWAATTGVQSADPESCTVVINATPLGLSATDELPLPLTALRRDAVVLDLVYAATGPTAWVRACRAVGMQALDGREVLLAQGAASWLTWLPGVQPPVEVMRAALDGHLD